MIPVTQQLWQAVMGNNPSHFKGERRSVESVSWHDAQEFLEQLNAREDVQTHIRSLGCGGQLLRLPTEAEWEFALSEELKAHRRCEQHNGPIMLHV